MKKTVYIVIVSILTLSLFLGFLIKEFSLNLGSLSFLGTWVSSPIALLTGIVFALVFGETFPSFTKTMSKKMLQYSVIGLGFGMNVNQALQSGREGMVFTIVSVFGTLLLGNLIGRKLLKVDSQTSYLISSGTAICGGSAIAAVGPTIKARSEAMSVSLGVVFILNAIGLFLFPFLGDIIGLDAKEFGMWAAIAIHDTSSVVGVGSAYDLAHPGSAVSALEVATTIKLTRALWIVILVILTPFVYKDPQVSPDTTVARKRRQKWYRAVPKFIVWFIVAILVNTYIFSNASLLGEDGSGIAMSFSHGVNVLAKQMITLSLFFIGAGLTKKTLKAVGIKPLLQGVLLWMLISVISLVYILIVS